MTEDRLDALVRHHEQITVWVTGDGFEEIAELTATIEFTYSPDRTPVLVAKTARGHELRLPIEDLVPSVPVFGGVS